MARPDASTCIARLTAICVRLPEAEQRPGGEGARHVAYLVRKKTFGYFTADHHGNGRLALATRAPAGAQEALIATDPERFFVPPYLGHRGWVGLYLDLGVVDWEEVRELMVESYCLAAPARLVAMLG